MRRVAITGLGAVTPIGNSVESFWAGLKDGTCGIGPITRFDTAEYKVKVAAEVKGFDPLAYMEKGDARKFDRFCQFALAAAGQAVEDSGVCGTLPPERVGTYFGSGIGGIETFAQQQQALVSICQAPAREMRCCLSPSKLKLPICLCSSGYDCCFFPLGKGMPERSSVNQWVHGEHRGSYCALVVINGPIGANLL